MQTPPETNRAALAIAAALLLAVLAACSASPPPPLAEVGGRAIVLGPDSGFDPATVKDPWWRSPRSGPNHFAVVDLDGTQVLRVDAPAADQPTTAVVGRRLAVPLLAMPYLHWAWYLEPAIFGGGSGDGLDRGLRVSVGFYGGAPGTPQLTDHLLGTGPAGYPVFDRKLDIIFGGVGAPRGEDSTQHMAAISEKGVAYELRAHDFGQAGSWKLEALDLARLYEHFWPRDRMNLVQISYIAVGGLGGRPTAGAQTRATPAAATAPLPLGYMAEVALTR
jgi:hypothetical protein